MNAVTVVRADVERVMRQSGVPLFPKEIVTRCVATRHISRVRAALDGMQKEGIAEQRADGRYRLTRLHVERAEYKRRFLREMARRYEKTHPAIADDLLWIADDITEAAGLAVNESEREMSYD